MTVGEKHKERIRQETLILPKDKLGEIVGSK